MSDFYTKHAAQYFKIPEEQVSKFQRNTIKSRVLEAIYGGLDESWEPLVEGELIATKDNEHLLDLIKTEKVYINNLYQVNVRLVGNAEINLMHLSIKLRDKQAIHDWRHFQQIKNQLCGPEACGIEFYPPESSLIDTANQYHVWVFDNADYFPFICRTRLVAEEELVKGSVQRPFEEHLKPEDLTTAQEMVMNFLIKK